MKRGLKSFRKLVDLAVTGTFIYFIIDLETYDSRDSMSSSEGYPVKRQIFSTWSKVEFPGKRGF